MVHPKAMLLVNQHNQYLNPPSSMWVTSETDSALSYESLYGAIENPAISLEDFTQGLDQLRWVATRRRHPLKMSFYYPLIAKLYEHGSWKNVREFGLFLKTLFNQNVPTPMRSAVMSRSKHNGKDLTFKYPMVGSSILSEDFVETQASVAEEALPVAEETPAPVAEETQASVVEEPPVTPTVEEGESDVGALTLGGVVFNIHTGGTIKIGKVETPSISSENLKSLTVDRVEGGVLYGVAMSR